MGYDEQKTLTPDEQRLPGVRTELAVTRQIYDGQPYWVYKDPISLRYYRFNREEHFIIGQMARGVTLGQLKQAHYEEFHGDFLTNGEIGQFISSLLGKNLLLTTQPDRDELFYRSSRKTKYKKFFAQLTNLLFFKVPVYDPDKMLGRVLPYIRFFWTRWFFLAYLALLAGAALLVAQRWPDFSYMFREQFFTLMNLPILMVAMWLIKVIHEFGHGFTCKYYGGEVHEIGFLVLVLAPFMYCNVTDSWTFQKKSHRILTTAAGIMTEVLLAAVAAIVWYLTEPPGFLHAFAFNIAILCSLSTILFNANPLMRFDGYYMIMDLMEVPNLRQRASKLMNSLFVRYLLGSQTSELPEEHKYKVAFPVYAVAAFIYRWFITFAILFTVYALFERAHLTVLGQALVFVTGGTMLLLPLYQGGRKLFGQRYELGITNTRLIAMLAIAIAAIGLTLFCPLPQHVTLNFILEPARMAWLRSEVPGQVNWSDQVAEGALIRKGETLAELTNVELSYQIEAIQAQMAQTRIDLSDATSRGLQEESRQATERLEMLARHLERLTSQQASLRVTAPFDGQILTATLDIERLQGEYVHLGTPLTLLAESDQLTARVWVPEKMLARIPQQQGAFKTSADLMLYAYPGRTFPGQIDSPASVSRELNMGELGEKLALSNKVGGEVLTEYDPATGQERPMEAVYEMTVNLNAGDLPESARPYLSGRIRIHCGHCTLFRWGIDSLRRVISPNIWL